LYQVARNDQAVSFDDALRYQLAGSQPKKIIRYDAGHWPLPPEYLIDQALWLQEYIGVDAEKVH
jgi:hypothetical protein